MHSNFRGGGDKFTNPQSTQNIDYPMTTNGILIPVFWFQYWIICFSDQTVGITGRIWRRRSLKGVEKEIELDMHDDDAKNRVFADRDHNLIIRNVEEKDGAYYFCYDVENRTSPTSMKMDILLDGDVLLNF